jgi:hypothetical protein
MRQKVVRQCIDHYDADTRVVDMLNDYYKAQFVEGHTEDESGPTTKAPKMMYAQIHACPKGYVLFRKEYMEAKYCTKCKSSRFMKVDSGDG